MRGGGRRIFWPRELQNRKTELVAEISARDGKDSTRENSPLRKAPDAEEIDTTAMTLEEQVEII